MPLDFNVWVLGNCRIDFVGFILKCEFQYCDDNHVHLVSRKCEPVASFDILFIPLLYSQASIKHSPSIVCVFFML